MIIVTDDLIIMLKTYALAPPIEANRVYNARIVQIKSYKNKQFMRILIITVVYYSTFLFKTMRALITKRKFCL